MASWVLSWPGVTVNHLYERSRFGYQRLAPAARTWKELVIVQVRQNRQPLPDGPLAFVLIYSPPNAQRLDGDNLLKLSQDAVCAALGIDDSCFVANVALRGGVDRVNPRIMVRIEPVPEALARLMEGEHNA